MSEIEALRERIAALEGERDAFAHQYAELLILQQVFTAMNSTLDVEDILAMVLRGIREALGFGRVVLFRVDDGVAARHLETAGDEGVITAADRSAFEPTASFTSIVAGEGDFATGNAEDGESPLSDAEGAYAMLPLVSRAAVRGVLYADRPATEAIDEMQIQALFDFAAQAALVAENARLYRETERLLEETRTAASTDVLTGLVNRRALLDQMEREIANGQRYKTAVTVMLLDLDDLKAINDGGGHAAGDDALRRFAGALKSAARKGDIVARYAGDEFVIVMSQADDRAATVAAERVIAAVRAESLRCSAGIAIYPMDGVTSESLIEAADRALYRAKRRGKDRFELHTIIVR